MKAKRKLLAGLRLNQSASDTVGQWATLTGRSANWVTSWCVDRLRTAMISPQHTETAKAELEAMGRVQSELQISAKKITAAKQKLAALRKNK